MIDGRTTYDGYRLAPAAPGIAADGSTVARVGIWAPGAPAPYVLTVDEIAVAIAHSGDTIGRYGTILDHAAEMTVEGVRRTGRGPLACMADRLRAGNELDVFPPGHVPARCLTAAAELCSAAHRNR
ncbi:hypothetical protein [Amycolatopsis sp. NPDC050768]|uniref:hypothetical protein n=1 Tax=Amycolatopsis sp. NPDC050768 TaxID=3154839 RepID=UPI0033CE4723